MLSVCKRKAKKWSKKTVTTLRRASFWRVISLFMLSLAFSVASTVLFRKYLYTTKNYPFIADQLTHFFPLPVFLIFCIIRSRSGKLKRQVLDSVPQSTFLFLGLLSAISNLMNTYGANDISGPLTASVQQILIPVTMLVNMIWLKTKFNIFHCIGSLTITAGVLLSCMPSFLGKGSNSVFVLVYGGSFILSAVQSVKMEKMFKENNIDVYYLQLIVGCYGVLLTFCLLPINLIIPPYDTQGLLRLLKDGIWCFLGVSSEAGDDCQLSGYFCGLYMLTWFAYTISSTYLLKFSSAGVLAIVGALTIPLSDYLFSLPSVMGPQLITEFEFFGICGVLFVVVGVVVHRTAFSEKKLKIPISESQVIFGDSKISPSGSYGTIDANISDQEEEEDDFDISYEGSYSHRGVVPQDRYSIQQPTSVSSTPISIGPIFGDKQKTEHVMLFASRGLAYAPLPLALSYK